MVVAYIICLVILLNIMPYSSSARSPGPKPLDELTINLNVAEDNNGKRSHQFALDYAAYRKYGYNKDGTKACPNEDEVKDKPCLCGGSRCDVGRKCIDNKCNAACPNEEEIKGSTCLCDGFICDIGSKCIDNNCNAGVSDDDSDSTILRGGNGFRSGSRKVECPRQRGCRRYYCKKNRKPKCGRDKGKYCNHACYCQGSGFTRGGKPFCHTWN